MLRPSLNHWTLRLPNDNNNNNNDDDDDLLAKIAGMLYMNLWW